MAYRFTFSCHGTSVTIADVGPDQYVELKVAPRAVAVVDVQRPGVGPCRTRSIYVAAAIAEASLFVNLLMFLTAAIETLGEPIISWRFGSHSYASNEGFNGVFVL
jgi:hypothetical protein